MQKRFSLSPVFMSSIVGEKWAKLTGNVSLSFYALKSHDEQNKYLFGLIEKKDVRRCQTEKPFKMNTFVYNVHLKNGNCIRVCKKTFCDLHAIGKRRVETLAAKIVGGVVFSLVMSEGDIAIIQRKQ